ncbi:hypothetical protein CW731_00715 [Polaribacter sp. ALD11]|uniref:hypothetical protein n=1 Tax=Polaribacter sp. ALD11 TaxID=2058137 RepID=UPI000C3116DD|nr:hypothetical protein [Polaribacter sp. ALD11]AUC83898.1 hypothetical protein CW731_00715 [Polaribacter sp. ALD11]
MKSTVKVISILNLILMAVFLSCLLVSIAIYELLFYALCIAFFLGIYQVLSSFLILIFWKNINKNNRRILVIYLSLVLVYFVSFYLLSIFYGVFMRTPTLSSIGYLAPVVLSLFCTYILESLKK